MNTQQLFPCESDAATLTICYLPDSRQTKVQAIIDRSYSTFPVLVTHGSFCSSLGRAFHFLHILHSRHSKNNDLQCTFETLCKCSQHAQILHHPHHHLLPINPVHFAVTEEIALACYRHSQMVSVMHEWFPPEQAFIQHYHNEVTLPRQVEHDPA